MSTIEELNTKIRYDLNRIQTNITNSLSKLSEKGVDVTDKNSNNLAELIDSITVVEPLPNGMEWTQVKDGDTPLYGDFKKLWYVGNLFFAYKCIGTNCTLWRSIDGKNWVHMSDFDASLDSDVENVIIQYIDNKYILNIVARLVMESTDGINWTFCSLAQNTSCICAELLYKQGIYLIIDTVGGNNNELYYCDMNIDDGSYTKNLCVISGTENAINCSKLYYYNGVWFAFDSSVGILFSTNAKEWDIATDEVNSISNFKCADNSIVVTTDTGVYYCTNGKTFIKSSYTTACNATKCSLEYGNGVWILSNPAEGVWHSEDKGATWQASNNNVNGGTFLAKYADGIFLVGSSLPATGGTSSGFYYSKDGATWSSTIPVQNSSNNDVYAVSMIEYNNGMWVVYGREGNNNRIFNSIDVTNYDSTKEGINKGGWLPGKTFPYILEKEKILYAKGVWVLAGKDGLYYSVGWEES